MARTNRRTTKAELEAQIAKLTVDLDRAERARRSLAIVVERTESERDTALQRLSTCSEENGSFRHQLRTALSALERAQSDLAALTAAVDERATYTAAGETVEQPEGVTS